MLLRLTEESAFPAIREGAVRALLEQGDAEVVSRMLDRIRTSIDGSNRATVVHALADGLREGKLPHDPSLVTQLTADFRNLPSELQLALIVDPTIRASHPDFLLTFRPDGEQWRDHVWALATDHSGHGVLSRYLSTHQQQGALLQAFAALNRWGGYADERISRSAAAVALGTTSAEGLRDFGWRMLSLGPPEDRLNALSQVPETYQRLKTDPERVKFVGSLVHAGADANGVLLTLLSGEVNPMTRLELTSAILSIPGNLVNEALLSSTRRLISAELDLVLSGQTGMDMQYAFAHPRGLDHGLPRYADLVRDVFTAYGKPEQIPMIQKYAERLLAPEFVRGRDPAADKWMRHYVQERLSEGVDAIRARHAN